MRENVFSKGHFTDNEFRTMKTLVGYGVWMPFPL